MPPAKRKAPKHSTTPVPPEEKIARLLGMLLVKDVQQKNEQVLLLRSVGFEIPEVASMLGMTANHVNVATNKARSRTRKKRPKSRNGNN